MLISFCALRKFPKLIIKSYSERIDGVNIEPRLFFKTFQKLKTRGSHLCVIINSCRIRLFRLRHLKLRDDGRQNLDNYSRQCIQKASRL